MAISTYVSFSIRLTQRYSAWQWWGIAVVLTLISQLAQYELGELYKQSLFPVSFFTGQTTFNAVELKGYFLVLIESGTLDRFFWVQVADYAFMVTVFLSFFALMAAICRSLPNWGWLKAIATAMLVIAPLAAVFDALENAVSFILLADPQGFADWLVYPYSSFAVIKFAIFGLTYLWVALALIIIAGNYLKQLLLGSHKQST